MDTAWSASRSERTEERSSAASHPANDAMAKSHTIELQPLPKPRARGGLDAQYLLFLDGRVLGELNESSHGYMAFDDGRGVWVGPFKRLSDAARFFRPPAAAPADLARPVIGIPTTKGLAFWSMHVDLVSRPGEDETPKKKK